MGYLRPSFNPIFFIPSEEFGGWVCLLFINSSFGNNPENGLLLYSRGIWRVQEETRGVQGDLPCRQ